MTKRTRLIIAGLASTAAAAGAVAILVITYADGVETRLRQLDAPPVGYEIAPDIEVISDNGSAGVQGPGGGFLPRGTGRITRIASLENFTVFEDRAGDSLAWFSIRADGAIARSDTIAAAAQHCGASQQALEGAFVAAGQWLARHPPVYR